MVLGEIPHPYPSKELGGESLVAYFGGLLFHETVAMYLRDDLANPMENRAATVKSTPLFSNAQKIIGEYKDIDRHLREQNLYFYRSDGSVFMDYKIMQERKYPSDGSLGRWQKEHIKPTMTSEQAFDICKKEVTTWWDVK